MAECETSEQLVHEEATDPAVLNVNPPSPPASLSSSRNDSAESRTREEMEPIDRSDIPPTIPGLNEMINEWQISSIPEEQQFFSTNGNLFDAAVRAIKSHLGEADSEVRKTWLLTE